MFMFGGWDYESILVMLDELVHGRRYGGFYDMLTNFTVKELLEIFSAIRNKEQEKQLAEAVSEPPGSKNLPTSELSEEVLDFLMNS